MCAGGQGGCMCVLSIFFSISFFSLSLSAPYRCLSIGLLCPLSGRLQLCVCFCALLFQGADSREVCLNREEAQRPCSSCRVWNQMIGPHFSLSICLSVLVFLSHFDSESSTWLTFIGLFLSVLFSIFCLLQCKVAAPGGLHWSAVFLLSSLPRV